MEMDCQFFIYIHIWIPIWQFYDVTTYKPPAFHARILVFVQDVSIARVVHMIFRQQPKCSGDNGAYWSFTYYQVGKICHMLKPAPSGANVICEQSLNFLLDNSKSYWRSARWILFQYNQQFPLSYTSTTESTLNHCNHQIKNEPIAFFETHLISLRRRSCETR